MFVADVEKETQSDGAFNFYAIGDAHIDSEHADETRLKRYVAHIAADPHAVASFVGDGMEGRTPGMKHYSPSALRDKFKGAGNYFNLGVDHLAAIFAPLPLAGVPLTITSGNHDEYVEGLAFASWLVDAVKAKCKTDAQRNLVQFLGPEGMLRIRTGRKRGASGMYTTTAYIGHGSGGGELPGGKVNKLQRSYEWVDADLIVAGHVHDGHVRIIKACGIQRRGDLDLVESARVMYRAPSFVRRVLKNKANYASRKMYMATDNGLQYVRMVPHTRDAFRREAEF